MADSVAAFVIAKFEVELLRNIRQQSLAAPIENYGVHVRARDDFDCLRIPRSDSIVVESRVIR